MSDLHFIDRFDYEPDGAELGKIIGEIENCIVHFWHPTGHKITFYYTRSRYTSKSGGKLVLQNIEEKFFCNSFFKPNLIYTESLFINPYPHSLSFKIDEAYCRGYASEGCFIFDPNTTLKAFWFLNKQTPESKKLIRDKLIAEKTFHGESPSAGA